MNIFQQMYANGIFKLTLSDWQKAALMAALVGFGLPFTAAIQTPGFSILTTDWHQVLILAINGALIGFVTYLVKNLFSDNQGRFLGRVG